MQDFRGPRSEPDVADRFDRADAYDTHATVQREVAQALAERVMMLGLPPAARVLEIGCGTGALTASLLDLLPGVSWHATDIAPAMIARARLRLGARPDIAYAVMDGERPDIAGPFDLICSSLAMQWFVDLPGSVARLRALLKPDGRLAFTTLVKGSFTEWRTAHGDLAPGLRDYPDAVEIAALGLDVTVHDHLIVHRDAIDFLRSLKGIGATVPRPGHRPLSAAALRRVMARFETAGSIARYRVATCIV